MEQPQRHKEPKKQIPLISVVVPVYNSSTTIAECLEAILANDYPDFEVIVVDDESSDNSVEIIKRFPVRLLELKGRLGAGAARQAGAKEAQGEIIAFTDADCVVPRDWLAKIAKRFKENPSLAGIGGVYKPHPQDGLISRFANWSVYISYYPFVAKDTDSLNTGNCAYRRDIFLSCPPPEHDYFRGMAAAEDTLLSMEISKKGKLIHDWDLYIYHRSRDTIPKLFKQQITRGYSRTILSAKHPKTQVIDKASGMMLHIITRLLSTFVLYISVLLTFILWSPWYLIAGFAQFILFLAPHLYKLYSWERSLRFVLVSILLFMIRDSGWIVGLIKGLWLLVRERAARR